MATNRIVQAVYDLKDNVTAKLKAIGGALGQNRDDVKRTADSLAGLRKAIVGLGALVGLRQIKEGIEEIINTGERLDDLSKEFASVFGGIAKGSQALEEIRTITAGVPQGFEDVAAAAIAMRKAGLDPLDGSLQSLLDNQNAVNQSQQDLIATIEALGKANVRGELNLRSFVSLTEQGIPVFQLLSQAMGISEDRVRALAESGKLGKDSIKLLIDELGKLRAGVGADELGDVDAQVQKLKDSAVEFLNTIAQSGALEFFRSELKSLNAEVAAAAKDGRLKAVADSISAGIVATAQAIKATVGFVYQYSSAIILLGKAYALVKVQSFLDGLALVASGTTKATGAVRLLATAITAIPAIRLAVLGGAAVALASDNLRRLGEVIGENLPATEKWNKRIEELKAEILAGSEVFRVAAERLAQFRNEQVLSADAAAKLSTGERAAQAERIAGLQKYLELQIRYYEQLRAADALNADGLAYLETLKAKLAEVGVGYDALAKGALIAADALANKLTPGAQSLANQLAGIGDSTKAASEGIADLIGDFDKLSTTKIGDIALAVEHVGESSDVAAARVRDGLAASLAKLSGADLLRFQIAASGAFEEVGRTGEETAVVLDTTLRVAMDRLKVEATDTGEAFTRAGKETIAAFQAVAENARATGLQIQASFRAALNGIKTKEEAEALGAALQAAASTGRIGFDELSVSTRELNERIRSITASLSPLASQFELLGIKSQAQLNAISDNARDAFDAVVDGARKGTAAQEDVVRAFRAYSDAARAAVADSRESARVQVEAQLQVQAAALGIADAMSKAGAAGTEAAGTTADAFSRAADEIEGAADAAGNLRDKADDAAGGLDRLAETAGQIGSLAQQAGISLGYMTDEAANAISAAVGIDGINNAMRKYEGQIFATREELDAFTASQKAAADAAVQAADDIAKLTDELRRKNDEATLSAAELERKRYEEQLQRIRDLEETAGASARAQAAELRGLAEAEHRRKLAEIAEEARAQRAANAQSQSSGAGASDASSGGSANGGGFGTNTPPPRSSRPGAESAISHGAVNINVTVANVTSPAEMDRFVRDLKRRLTDLARLSR